MDNSNLETIQRLINIRNDIAGRIQVSLQYQGQLENNGKDKFDIENESEKRRNAESIDKLSRQFEAVGNEINDLVETRYGLNQVVEEKSSTLIT